MSEPERFRVSLMDPTEVLLREVADPVMKRNDVALTYALALCSDDDTDWAAVNKAIIERWSRAALLYIKARAWKIAREAR